MADEEQFDNADSGASKTFPKQCSALRKGDFVVIKNRPCKIVEMSTSKTGKHGHAKVHLVALDVFSGKKYEDICPSTHNMNCPVVERTDFSVIDVNDEYLTLMDDGCNTREDLKLPPEDSDAYKDLKPKLDLLKADGINFTVTVVKAMGMEQVMESKNERH